MDAGPGVLKATLRRDGGELKAILPAVYWLSLGQHVGGSRDAAADQLEPIGHKLERANMGPLEAFECTGGGFAGEVLEALLTALRIYIYIHVYIDVDTSIHIYIDTNIHIFTYIHI